MFFLMNVDLPGKNPGTSTNVTMGILKASQNRTKRAPFTEALISRQPDGIQEVCSTKSQLHSHNGKVIYEQELEHLNNTSYTVLLSFLVLTLMIGETIRYHFIGLSLNQSSMTSFCGCKIILFTVPKTSFSSIFSKTQPNINFFKKILQ